MTDPFSFWTKAGVDEATAWGAKLETATADRVIEVLTETITGDGMGGSTSTWSTALTFNGRILVSGRQPQSVAVGGTSVISQLWEIVAPSGMNISTTARLRDQVSGTTYAIVTDDEPKSESAAAHILCYEV